MASTKEFQRKIGSLKNSRKITGSMKMISSIKLQKVAAVVEKSAEFRASARVIQALLGSRQDIQNTPVLQGYPDVKTVDMLLITGDRGLCGRFNANSINLFMLEREKIRQRNIEVVPSCIGLRGAAYLKRRHLNPTVYDGVIGNPEWDTIREVGKTLFDRFTSGECQEVWVVYGRRISSMSEEPCLRRLLPFEASEREDTTLSAEYVREFPHEAFGTALEMLTVAGVFDAVVLSALAENAARMSAMDNASSNCDRLIDKYTQLRNRARQAVITTELNEIVTGKEALET